MTKTMEKIGCHAHPEARAKKRCAECGEKACERRCFLNGRTKYCKPCRDKMKKEKAEQKPSRTMKALETLADGFTFAAGVCDTVQVVASVAVLALVGFAYVALKSLDWFLQ